MKYIIYIFDINYINYYINNNQRYLDTHTHINFHIFTT